MNRHQATCWNAFEAVEVTPTRNGIRAVVKTTDRGLLTLTLPRPGKYVRLCGRTLEVREWLAVKTGLLRPYRGKSVERKAWQAFTDRAGRRSGSP